MISGPRFWSPRWEFLSFKNVSRMLRFSIMSHLLLWDSTHLLASQILVHINPQPSNVPQYECKTLDVWREITCSSLFSGTWQHPHSHSSLVLFFYFKSGLCRDTRVHHTKSLTAASIKIFNWAPQSFDKFLDLNSLFWYITYHWYFSPVGSTQV